MHEPRALVTCAVDHLVVAAPTLETGARYVYETLGAAPLAGGQHARMGTHNRLLGLGESLYVEVIAIDAEAAVPSRPRWFALDALARDAAPRLATWVVRTSDIEGSLARSGLALGEIEPMSRGSLDWRITIPADGSLPFDGVMPALIQWSSREHPTAGLRDCGCRLVRLEGRHREAERIRAALHAIGFNDAFSVAETFPGEPPSLVAVIDTPFGRRTLGMQGL